MKTLRIHQYITNLLLILIVIYLAQGGVYEKGSALSKGSLIIYLIISIFYLIKTLFLKGNKNILYKAWTVIFFLNVLGFIFTGEWNNPLHIGMLQVICFGFMGFYPFYFFARRDILRRQHLIAFFIFMLIASILSFYHNQQQILLERLNDNENVVNNVAYMFVGLIPFVFLLVRYKLIAFGSISILLYFIVLGSKRGALITGVMGFIIFIYYFLIVSNKRFSIRNYIIGFIALGVIIYFGYEQLGNNEYFMSRLESTGQNKEVRNINFASLWQAWLNSESYLNIFFGYGFMASLKVGATGNFAHNDWLELLSNFGIVGISLYTWLFYSSYKMIYRNKLVKEKKYILICTLIVWFFPTLFSMGIYSYNFVFTGILLNYAIFSGHSEAIHVSNLSINDHK